MSNYNAEDFKGFYDEINNEKRAEDREDKVLQMSWQRFNERTKKWSRSVEYDSNNNKWVDKIEVDEMKKCIEEAKQFIKIYEEQK